MDAARRASDETVAFLLSKGASPDLVDNNNLTALVDAVKSGCSSTIALLGPVTTKGLGEALKKLAAFHTELTPAVEDLVRKAAASEKDAEKKGMVVATKFGAARMLNILIQCWDKNTLDSTIANHLLKIAILSDNADTVDTIRAFVKSISSENRDLALTRGRADVAKVLGLGEDEKSIEAAKKRLKAEIVNKTASIGERMPKSVEFAYDDEMTKLRPLLSQSVMNTCLLLGRAPRCPDGRDQPSVQT